MITTKENIRDQPDTTISKSADVQSYLISNYRDALKKGDKSAAKSCLLAARYFSVNEPNLTKETYISTKSDGDVSEASKCFADIFNDLFLVQDAEKSNSNELLAVVDRIKAETRVLLSELQSFFLKLRSSPILTSFTSKQASSTNPSPMLSPRMKMSSDDRRASSDSSSKLDKHKQSTTRGFFYQKLFNNIPDTTKREILNYSIKTCENSFEQCKLMMLALSVFNDSVTEYGARLIKLLIELCDEQVNQKDVDRGCQNAIICRRATSLLVLDAIPQVTSLCPIETLDLNSTELYERSLKFYSDYCLETFANEHDINELHDGVKKSIAARILGTTLYAANDEDVEEHLIQTLNLLSLKAINSLDDTDIKIQLKKLQSIVVEKDDQINKSDLIIAIIRSLDLEKLNESSDKIRKKDDAGNSQITVSPPKSRGRPKRLQQPVQEDSTKRCTDKTREIQLFFHLLIQHMLTNCGQYLKNTKSRVILNFANPLADQIESDLIKGSSSQRTSRSKASTPSSTDVTSGPIKKMKLKIQEQITSVHLEEEESPLNSEESKMKDLQIVNTLMEAHKCLDFLVSDSGPFSELWSKFLRNDTRADKLNWYERLRVDSLLIMGHFDEALRIISATLEENLDLASVDKEKQELGTTNLAIASNTSSVKSADLRRLVQIISCHMQQLDKQSALTRMDELFNKLKLSGLLSEDDGYSSGSLTFEYKVAIRYEQQDSLGFLFFDSLSILRYCIGTLVDISRRYLLSGTSVTDTIVGNCIILSQFDWPKNGAVYDQCIAWLRAHKPKSTTPQCLSAATKFTYPQFFQYIRNPNIIEDFMAMLCQGYTLDIKGNGGVGQSTDSQTRLGTSSQTSSSRNHSSGTTSRSAKVITTRGVNKTFKEDLKVALTSQMKNSAFIMPLDVISEFIQSTLIPQCIST